MLEFFSVLCFYLSFLVLVTGLSSCVCVGRARRFIYFPLSFSSRLALWKISLFILTLAFSCMLSAHVLDVEVRNIIG